MKCAIKLPAALTDAQWSARLWLALFCLRAGTATAGVASVPSAVLPRSLPSCVISPPSLPGFEWKKPLGPLLRKKGLLARTPRVVASDAQEFARATSAPSPLLLTLLLLVTASCRSLGVNLSEAMQVDPPCEHETSFRFGLTSRLYNFPTTSLRGSKPVDQHNPAHSSELQTAHDRHCGHMLGFQLLRPDTCLPLQDERKNTVR